MSSIVSVRIDTSDAITQVLSRIKDEDARY